MDQSAAPQDRSLRNCIAVSKRRNVTVAVPVKAVGVGKGERGGPAGEGVFVGELAHADAVIEGAEGSGVSKDMWWEDSDLGVVVRVRVEVGSS